MRSFALSLYLCSALSAAWGGEVASPTPRIEIELLNGGKLVAERSAENADRLTLVGVIRGQDKSGKWWHKQNWEMQVPLKDIHALSEAGTARILNEKPKTPATGPDKESQAAAAWLKELDSEYHAPRFADVSAAAVKYLTSIRLGGHRKSDNKHMQIPPDRFEHLAAMKTLLVADFNEVDSLSDVALAHIGKVVSLVELHVADAPVTDAGLAFLGKLQALQRLNLGWTKGISDKGLPHLYGLKRLVWVNLSATQATPLGISELKKHLPNCVVDKKK